MLACVATAPPTQPLKSTLPNVESDFGRLVSDLSEALGDDKGLDTAGERDVERIQMLLANYASKFTEWSKFVHWSPAAKYTRNLVDDGNGKFNLMLLCWPPGAESPIHDHPNSHCIMKILGGQMRERRYKEEKGALRRTTERYLGLNEVAYMHDRFGLHAMGNASGVEPAFSLHLYSPPIPACKIYASELSGAIVVPSNAFHSYFGVKSQEI